jgi:hypothetical protein
MKRKIIYTEAPKNVSRAIIDGEQIDDFLPPIQGRQHATLTITEDTEKERQERITAWRQFGEAIINSGEILEGEPERLQFRALETIL